LIPASAAMAARQVVLLPLPALLLHRKTGVLVRTIFAAQARVLAAAGIMGAAVWLLRVWLQPTIPSLPLLVLLVCAGGCLYIALIAMWMPNYTRNITARVLTRIRPSGR
jgi:hypothetical protein